MLEEEGLEYILVPVLSVWHTITCALPRAGEGEKSIPTEERLPWRVSIKLRRGTLCGGSQCRQVRVQGARVVWGVKAELGKEGG